ncbi:hypothetical protein GW915_04785 [bacterium]|nr:hypothetical protein [bacterium]
MKPSINAKILLLGAVLVSCSWRGPASSDSGRAPSSAEGALNSGELEAPAAKVLGQYLALLNEGSFLTREQAHEKLEKIPANEKDLSGKDVAYIFNASQMRAVSGSESLKSVLIEYRVVGSVDSEAGFQQIPEVAVFALFNLQKIKNNWRIVHRKYFHDEYVGPFLNVDAGVRELVKINKPTSSLESLKN